MHYRILLILIPLLSGCGSTLSFGAGYDLQHNQTSNDCSTSTCEYYEQYRHIGASPFTGTFEFETPRFKGVSGKFFHASSLGGSDYATVDIVSANYTFVLGTPK